MGLGLLAGSLALEALGQVAELKDLEPILARIFILYMS